MFARSILGGRVQLLYTGKRQGNFSPKIGDGILNPRLEPIRGLLGGSSGFIFSPRLGFTTRWIEAGHTSEWTRPEHMLWRSMEPADGVIIPAPRAGVSEVADPVPYAIAAGFNADCPFGVILWPDGRIGFCHLGLECVLPKDGSSGILDTVPLESSCRVHITAGIGPCCYGRNDGGFDYVFERFPETQSVATTGSRKGQPALDLRRLIHAVLEPHRVTFITEDMECTAHSLYYSNVADRGTPYEGGRNCVAVSRITI